MSFLDTRAKPAFLLALAAGILLVPSLLAGRPFVYWDTPTFYGWGRDILEAVRDPWPALDAFPEHRGLWAADNFRGAWDRITPEQFQLVLTSIGARSKFYAVPLYALGSTLTLWAPVALQALIAAWLLRITLAVTIPGACSVSYLGVVAALTAVTPLPFFVGFLMPDVFAGFALLAAALLLCFHDRLARGQRAGCGVLLAYAILVHLSIVPAVVVVFALGPIVLGTLVPAARFLPGARVVAAALLVAGVVGAVSDRGMKAVFGQDVRSPPFLEGRVIVDGPGQQFLRDECSARPFAACRWKDLAVPNTDDIIWPDVTWHGLPLITDPAERRRFLDEQPAVVLGTVLRYPFAQFRASAGNALDQFGNFKISYDVGQALTGLINKRSDRTMRVVQITPNIGPCLVDEARACDHGPFLRYLHLLHYAVMVVTLATLAACVARWAGLPAERRATAEEGRLLAFALVVLAGVALNAVVCGAMSGSYGRYQARVVWLMPMATFLLLRHVLGAGREPVAAAKREGLVAGHPPAGPA